MEIYTTSKGWTDTCSDWISTHDAVELITDHSFDMIDEVEEFFVHGYEDGEEVLVLFDHKEGTSFTINEWEV